MQSLAGDALTERDTTKNPLTPAEVARLVDQAGSVAALLNTRHAIAKASGWKEKPPSKAVYAKAAAGEPNLLRRPIIARGRRAIVSRDEAEISAFLS